MLLFHIDDTVEASALSYDADFRATPV